MNLDLARFRTNVSKVERLLKEPRIQRLNLGSEKTLNPQSVARQGIGTDRVVPESQGKISLSQRDKRGEPKGVGARIGKELTDPTGRQVMSAVKHRALHIEKRKTGRRAREPLVRTANDLESEFVQGFMADHWKGKKLSQERENRKAVSVVSEGSPLLTQALLNTPATTSGFVCSQSQGPLNL